MIVYTDGACSQNGTWDGGWCFKAISNCGTVYIESNFEENTTNNRMELLAFLKGLEFIQRSNEIPSIIYTDSAYISNCFPQKWYINWEKNNWKTASKQPVKNQDLWKEIINLVKLLNPTILKVKGHSDNKHNSEVDFWAVQSRKNKRGYIFNENINCNTL